jgi:hypothetical protein
MKPLEASSLRSNLRTWAVPSCHLPAVAHVLHDVLPNEPWDPHFLGQRLQTTYFDTANFRLRKARVEADRYLTLRLRCYRSPDGSEMYALSAKTEAEKFRQEVQPADAEYMLSGQDGGEMLLGHLPAHLLARAQELLQDEGLEPVVTVCCRRYAVEDSDERFTLDVEVSTDTGRCLGYAVREYKSTDRQAPPPVPLLGIALRPIKLSKFLWATSP